MNWKSAPVHWVFVKNSPLVVPRLAAGILRTGLGQQRLRSVEISVTNRCQCRCPFCYANEINENAQRELSLEDIKSIWKQCREQGAIHVNITGGEPLLRKDICEIVQAFGPKSTVVSLVTNGLLLDEKKVRALKKAGLNTLQISIDFVDAKKHDDWRGVKGCWEKAMAGAKLAKKHGINVCLSSVLAHGKKSFDEFDKILKVSEKNGYFLLINTAGDVGRWQDKESNRLTKKELVKVRDYWKNPLVRQDNMFNFSMKSECPAGREKIYVTCEGEIMPCDRLQEGYGNALKTPLKKILEKMRKEYNRKTQCYRYEQEWKEIKGN